MPNSVRKHIRQEKARIRRNVLSSKEQKEQIDSLCQEFSKKSSENKKKNENKGDIQPSNK
jgi:hypothetical protein